MARLAAFLGVALVVGAAWLAIVPAVSVTQPFSFDHGAHRGAACVLCHQGASTAARAGIPQGDLCLKCHATSPTTVNQGVWSGIANGDRIPWLRVTKLPAHVFFSHRRHVAIAGLACASCHGDMASRSAPPERPPVLLDMDTCLGCHQAEGASRDCAACHR